MVRGELARERQDTLSFWMYVPLAKTLVKLDF